MFNKEIYSLSSIKHVPAVKLCSFHILERESALSSRFFPLKEIVSSTYRRLLEFVEVPFILTLQIALSSGGSTSSPHRHKLEAGDVGKSESDVYRCDCIDRACEVA
jgi:hypothetical protein